MLYNAVGYYLATDQLKNGGPASLARSGAASHCSEFNQPGLTLVDIFATEATIPIAGFNIVTYPNKVRDTRVGTVWELNGEAVR